MLLFSCLENSQEHRDVMVISHKLTIDYSFLNNYYIIPYLSQSTLKH